MLDFTEFCFRLSQIASYGYVLGHSGSMHSQMSVSSPWHFPPLASSTILTRVLFFVQIPHVTEQTPGVQLDHSQSVAKKDDIYVRKLVQSYLEFNFLHN